MKIEKYRPRTSWLQEVHSEGAEGLGMRVPSKIVAALFGLLFGLYLVSQPATSLGALPNLRVESRVR